MASGEGAGGLRRCVVSVHGGSVPGKLLGKVWVLLQVHEAESLGFLIGRAVISNCGESWRSVEAGEVLEESESSTGARAA